MTAFGQSLTPKIFQSTALRTAQNRWDVYVYVCRLLQVLGMKHHAAASIVNPLDPANANYQPPSGSTEHHFALFDYPDTSTFSINGNTYRPCVIVMCPDYGSDVTTLAVEQRTSIWIESIYRDANNGFTMTSQWGHNKMRGRISNNGFFSTTTNDTLYSDNRSGALITLANWRPSSASFSTRTATMLIKNTFGYLGPAGLFLAFGDDDTVQSRSGLTRWCNFGFVFGGARIPNRARSVPSDYDLNRTNPIVPLCFLEAQTNILAGVGGWVDNYGGNTSSIYRCPRAFIMGFQFKDRHTFQADATNGDGAPVSVFNLTNLDRPLFPVYRLNTTASPRAVSGSIRHILGRMVYIVDNGSYRSTKYYNEDLDYPLGNNNIASFYNSMWEDAWDCPGIRIADSVAPLGEYTDPDTNFEWWFHWWNGANCNVALYSEGRTIVTTLPTLTFGTDTNHPINSTGGTDASTVASALVAPTYNGGLSISRYNSWSIGTNFTYVAASNILDFTQASSSSGSSVVEFVFSPPVGLEPEWDYYLSYSAYRRGGTENNTSLSSLSLDVLNNLTASWQSYIAHPSAGANTGNTMWNYTARTTVRLWTTGGSDQAINARGNIRFRFTAYQSGAASNTLARVGDITIIRRKLQ